MQPSSEVVLEGGLVAALLQTIKGKKLISRSMRHLTTTQRWALTPVILARTLQAVNPKSADGKSSEEEVVEQKLMKVLVQFVQSESHLSEENMELGRMEFSVNLLKNLRQCVRYDINFLLLSFYALLNAKYCYSELSWWRRWRSQG